MRAKPSLASRLTMAALISALAAVLMVAVGPGLADKPDDAGTPNEHASEQAQESTSDDGSDTTASEESTDASADETADTTASEDATEVAATDTAEHVPPGQEKEEDSSGEEGSTDEAVLGATSDPSTTAANSQGSDKVNEDTSQTGLPRGQSEDECTNEHHGDDNDFSGHGANQHGLYDNTCDGRASENGSGGGNATGRPCMGCVGNADDKNPKGQSPNHLGGKDHNAGYECDRNKGVGQGNPAHTDCRPTDVITICHSDDDGDTWRVITDTRDDIEDILAEDGPQFAFVVAAGTDPDDCEDDDDDDLDIDVSCRTVQVTSTENIASVRVVFADGSTELITGINGKSFSRTFTKDLDSAIASAGSMVESDEAPDDCGEEPPCEDGPGNSDRCIRITIECRTVSVTAKKNITHISVNYADGTSETFNVPGNQTTFSRTFTKDLASATAKVAGKTATASVSGDCGEEDEDELQVNASCSSVSATASQNISSVSVFFQDGSSEVFNNVNAKTFSRSFDEDVERATAVAGALSDSDDVSGDCGNTNRRPDEDTVCHSLDGEDWDVITDDEDDIDDDHLRPHDFDFPVSRGTSSDECEDEEEFCPEGTDREGEAMPDDRECDIPPVVNPGAKLCPADSDMAGLPVPEGVLANCWPPAVLPGLVERPAKPVVAPGQIPGRPPTEQPGVLPFTGASVLAFLVLALQLIAAGTLILRGKKA